MADAPSRAPVIELLGVGKSFDGVRVLEDIHLAIPAGLTTAIIGASGTGKSVLIKHVIGLLSPDEGQVKVFGQDVARASGEQLYALRRRMGMLFQDGALFDSLTVGQNVGFPLEHHRMALVDLFPVRRIRK